tara:strand:- start:497 stop:994 length:498 start_codon:yes stop_codon:yes gene_type:complete
MEGFAHAHHDDVSEGLFSFGREMGVEESHLGHHFSSGEVTLETHLPGSAEDAAHGAAGLAADAGSVAAPVSHEDGFDFLAVVEAEDKFTGAAIAAGDISDDSGLGRRAFGEPITDAGGEVIESDRVLIEKAVEFLGMDRLDSFITKGVFEMGKGEVVERVHAGRL